MRRRGTEASVNCVQLYSYLYSCTYSFAVVQLVGARKVDVRLPEKENSDSHGARPVHQIITMITWIRTSRLSMKNSLSGWRLQG